MLPFSRLFDKCVCFVLHTRKFSVSSGSGLSWTYVNPYQAVKIDLCDSSSLERWTNEGADKEFKQCLASKSNLKVVCMPLYSLLDIYNIV